MKITFVCTGNTCRSSMAEALARRWLETNAPGCMNIQVESAGLAAYPGSLASPQAVEVMGLAGIDLGAHRARQFSADMAEKSDLILTMTAGHKRVLTEKFPAAAGKTYTLAEFAGREPLDIPDPIGRPVEVYEKCAREIRELVGEALHKILKQARY